MILELVVDNQLVESLEEENEHLRLKLEAAEKAPQVIEINDHRASDVEIPHYEDFVDFSQKW